MTPLRAVLRVVNVLPQVHVTVVCTYSGWMPLFTGSLLGSRSPGRAAPVGAHVNRNLLQCARPLNQGPGTLIPVLRPGPSVVLAARYRRVALHLHEELRVALRLLHAVQEQLDRLLRVERAHDPAQLPDDVELLLRHEDLLTPRPGGVDVDGGEDALVGQLARQPQLHVPGALELLEDDLVHLRAGFDQRRRHDRQRTAVLDVPGSAEEP